MIVHGAAAIVEGTAPPLDALEAAVREHLPLCVKENDRFRVLSRRTPKAFVVLWVSRPRGPEAPSLASFAAALARSLSARAWSIRGHRGTSVWDQAYGFDHEGRTRWKGAAQKLKREWATLELDLDTSSFLEPSPRWLEIGTLDFSASRPTLVPVDVRAVARELALPPIPARRALAISGQPGWWLELTPSRADPYASAWLFRSGFALELYCTGARLSQPLVTTAPDAPSKGNDAAFQVLMRRRGREVWQVAAWWKTINGKTWLLLAHHSLPTRDAAGELKNWEKSRARAVRETLLEKAIAGRQSKIPTGLEASDVDASTFTRAIDEGAEALARKLFALQPRATRKEWLEELMGFDVNPARIRVAAALGADPNRVLDESSSAEPELIKAAINAGARPAALLLDGVNQGPLHRAETVDEVKMLSRLGFPLDAQDRDGDTPLHAALARANLEVATALIGLGARCDVVGASGTALEVLEETKAPAALIKRARTLQRKPRPD